MEIKQSMDKVISQIYFFYSKKKLFFVKHDLKGVFNITDHDRYSESDPSQTVKDIEQLLVYCYKVITFRVILIYLV